MERSNRRVVNNGKNLNRLLLPSSLSSSSNKDEMVVAKIMSVVSQIYVQLLLIKPEGYRLVGRSRHRWEHNTAVKST